MTSEVSICNNALAKVGHEGFIVDLNEDSKAARFCRIIYPEARDKLQRNHIWRFTVSRRVLAPTTDVDPFDEGNYFQIPDDCLRIIGTSLDQSYSYQPWRRERDKIIARGTDALELLYCARVVDPNKFDVSFSDLLSTYIGFELCAGLVRDTGMKNTMWDIYQKDSRKAAFVSATEQEPTKLLSEYFTGARY